MRQLQGPIHDRQAWLEAKRTRRQQTRGGQHNDQKRKTNKNRSWRRDDKLDEYANVAQELVATKAQLEIQQLKQQMAVAKNAVHMAGVEIELGY